MMEKIAKTNMLDVWMLIILEVLKRGGTTKGNIVIVTKGNVYIETRLPEFPTYGTGWLVDFDPICKSDHVGVLPNWSQGLKKSQLNTNLAEHINSYYGNMMMMGVIDAIIWWAFFSTFTGWAVEWFKIMELGSIYDFIELTA